MCGLKLGIPEAVFRRCSSKWVFLNILQTHRKAPVLESLFDKVKGLKACNFIKKRLRPVTLLKRDSNTGAFLPNL